MDFDLGINNQKDILTDEIKNSIEERIQSWSFNQFL